MHCDPTASHYLKVILDTIFGPAGFRNEIVWKRTSAHSDVVQGARQVGRIHDILLFYSKSYDSRWNATYVPYDPQYVESVYRYVDEAGRRYQTQPLHAAKPGGDTRYPWKGKLPPPGRYWAFSKENMGKLEAEGRIVYSRTGTPRYKIYLDESLGKPIQDIWDDITPVHVQPKERQGYATQKPLALLERIIQASSNEGDVVLDPFCGCGTAVLAAHRLGRRWIGIDVTNLAITVMRKRLADAFPGLKVPVVGEPTTITEARALAVQEPDGRWQFQWWALGLIGALPASDKRRKGADQGIDGFFSVHYDNRGKFTQVIVQVKSGHAGAAHVRDLRGVIGDDRLGIFITLEEPTEPMRIAASQGGLYENSLMDRLYPRVQVLTIEDLLGGKKPNLPPRVEGPGGPRIGQRVQQGALLSQAEAPQPDSGA